MNNDEVKDLTKVVPDGRSMNCILDGGRGKRLLLVRGDARAIDGKHPKVQDIKILILGQRMHGAVLTSIPFQLMSRL
ncbi:hypothetical protein SUGI_0032710 [Cryptomeria japonica]|nr:hypothetical protein SUGI_0032710 [Cryptomeria japonica]